MFAEGKTHQMFAFVLIGIKHLAWDRDHTGHLGQCQAELASVVVTEGPYVDRGEVGALRGVHIEPSIDQSSVQPVSFALQGCGEVGEIVVAQPQPNGDRRLERSGVHEREELFDRTDRIDQLRPGAGPTHLPTSK